MTKLAIPLKRGPSGRRLRLMKRKPDWFMRYRVEGIDCGPDWSTVTADELHEVLEYNLRRLDKLNSFLGTLVGKTVIIMGLGPQLRRFTSDCVEHLANRDDVVMFGVNGVPAYCKKVWGLNPGKIFDHIVGADAVHPYVWNEWGWNECNGTSIWRKGRVRSEASLPIISSSSPSLAADLIYYIDSVSCCISLAILGLTTTSREKKCWGPTQEWNQKFLVEAKDGKIILVGVEHNRRDHCYTGNPEFLLDDRPHTDWGNMEPKKSAHAKLAAFAKEVGAKIYSAAPWSIVDEHEFVDFEEFLNIPDELKTGITSKGIPDQIESCYEDPAEAALYFQHQADNIPVGVRPKLKEGYNGIHSRSKNSNL